MRRGGEGEERRWGKPALAEDTVPGEGVRRTARGIPGNGFAGDVVCVSVVATFLLYLFLSGEQDDERKRVNPHMKLRSFSTNRSVTVSTFLSSGKMEI